MKRFEIIHRIPSPYRVHMFTEMWRQLEAKGIQFHVHFASDMRRGYDERPLSWRNPKMDFPHTYWRDYGWKHYQLNPGMIWHVRKLRPDWLFVGSPYDNFTSIMAAWLCQAKVRITWQEGNTKDSGIIKGAIGAFKRKVLSKYDYVAVPGIDGFRYVDLHQSLTDLKMPRPVMLPNLIDETRFRPRSGWNLASIEALRSRFLDASHDKLCLIPARLEPVKGLCEFVSILDKAWLDGWRIVILGQGSLKVQLNQLICERELAESISILDFVDYAEMPAFYAAADLFLLPSLRDPNPLSVVEALHSGLPMAVTELAGNVDEAVSESKNGWLLPVRNGEHFQKTLKQVFSTGIEKLREMGEYSKCHNASFWSTEQAVSNFLSNVGVK